MWGQRNVSEAEGQESSHWLLGGLRTEERPTISSASSNKSNVAYRTKVVYAAKMIQV